MVELYTENYKKMKYHSDQALDLCDNSYIFIYSCYKNHENPNRILKIKNKTTKKIETILMEHNSVILFSTETNNKYLHKIILKNTSNNNSDDYNNTSNNWIGITFRLSKTIINFINDIPYINYTNNILTKATEKEKEMFYKLRSQENKTNGEYKYPEINYTISSNDILKPKKMFNIN
jgi:hypothetical protein